MPRGSHGPKEGLSPPNSLKLVAESREFLLHLNKNISEWDLHIRKTQHYNFTRGCPAEAADNWAYSGFLGANKTRFLGRWLFFFRGQILQLRIELALHTHYLTGLVVMSSQLSFNFFIEPSRVMLPKKMLVIDFKSFAISVYLIVTSLSWELAHLFLLKKFSHC
jgi:hypothetical protein